MAPNLLLQNGAQLEKPPRWVPVFIDKAFTGLYTQRSALHDPSNLVVGRFYGGRPDALIDGLNVELTNRLTLARRPGHSLFSSTTYPTAPTRAFEFRLSDNTIQILIDTPTGVYFDQQNGSKTLIYTKLAGAGQAHFVSVGDICYIGDGVSLLKYTPKNPNGTTWNYSPAAPTAAPTVTTVQSGSSAVAWQANTVFSTFGIIIDSNGNAQQLISTQLNGNTTQFGTTGQGQPAWNQTPGGTVVESSGTPITWKNFGQIEQWQANHSYPNQTPIYDPVTDCVFTQFNANTGTSGSTKPKFNSALGSFTFDNGAPGINTTFCQWGNVGKVSDANSLNCKNWAPATSYFSFDTFRTDRMLICEPVLPNATNTVHGGANEVTIYLQASQTTGTSGSGYTPPFATVAGGTAEDNNNRWVCLGTATWSAAMTAVAWTAGQAIFTVIQDTNTPKLLWVCTKGGSTASGFVFPASSNYGDKATDANGVEWTCLGPAGPAWAANTIWFLPVGGWVPPSPSQQYAGAAIKDSNGNVQYCTTSGKSGGSAPAWSTVQYSLNATTDSGAKWTMAGVASANALSWTSGHCYAYSFKARATTDFYVTNGLLTQINTQSSLPPALQAVLGLGAALGTPYGSQSGGVSTASPYFQITGANAGAVNTVSGLGPTDPQIDTIVIWRDADGGGPSQMFDLIEIPAPKPVNGVAQPWQFADFLPDTPTTMNSVQYPGLNNLIPAPIADVNDPPPAGFLPMAYHFGRIWGAVGTQVFFSGGPDTDAGNPNEAYNPSDEFSFLSAVTRLLHTSSGLFTFTTSDTEIIAGGPSTASFYQDIIAAGVGLLSYNALDMYGGEIYFLSSDGQLYVMTANQDLPSPGFPIGDKLAAFNAASAYVAIHNSGTDNAVFVADGSTGWYRLNPHQVPQNEAIWSPLAQVAGGAGMVQSVEITPGVHKLLVGGTGANQSILKRDTTVFSDNGTSYDAYFIMGSIVLAHPGQIAAVKFIEADFAKVGTSPTVSTLFNEISGTFSSLISSVSDPPLIYGAAGSPSTLFANRYYLSQNRNVSLCRHLQIKVDFGNDTVQNEANNLTIYGRIFGGR
ncbi:MAG TPA: hypothetical protein VFI60_05670 [Candidatus Acidoferrum sp.]|nr:hypothetical protein [Candidatus Acidoferrum sp.]